MTLANLDLGELRSKVLAAYRADDPTLQRFRVYARRLRAEVRPLRAYAVNAVSFVSADGGDNRLRLDPAAIELVRVVDSRGNQCALDAVPSTVTLEELEQRAVSGSQSVVLPLERLCRDLGKRLGDLSYIIGGVGQPGKTTGALRCYRDMVEWAVLYDLVANPTLRWGGDTILIRDGLLRTKAVAAHAKRNVTLSLVGVAKQNAVLGRLAVALELEGTFYRPFPCYVRVPEDIERECYNFDRTWLDTYETSEPEDDGRRLYQSLGRLFLVKFGDQSLDPVWPVDIAEWQVKDAEKVLGQLTVDAQQGFPIPDYPMTIQRAHDFAKLTGLTITLLEDLLLEGMSQDLTSDERDRLLRLKYLGRSLAALRYKEG
jgi:hypothetical protein